MSELIFDVAVIGGSLGGVQAALSAAGQGKTVYLCEETDWVGGQLTSQAVPPDEHPWIESCGCTRSYRAYRNAVRDYYRCHPQAAAPLRNGDPVRPGGAWVSAVAHEPTLAHRILTELLAPHVEAGRITLRLNARAVSSVVRGRRIESVRVEDMALRRFEDVRARFFLDATDCGDLLPIVGARYRTGAESRQETGEPHAPEHVLPDDMQPCTWVAALELSHAEPPEPMARPALYELFRAARAPYADMPLLSWYGPDAATGRETRFAMFDEDDPMHCGGLWRYRRIIAREEYTDGRPDVTLFNWPQNDYGFGNLYDDPGAAAHRELARQLTLCAAYWLRYDAPRPDGVRGYPVRLRPDITGTASGLAKAPYIRESRRICALHTVCEQEISREFAPGILRRADSVGIGHYAIDIHPTTRTHSFFYSPAWPLEIPLSAMIPLDRDNLIPACKNIGCTHLTNGCFRLHPVEWNIGEAAGLLASFCIDRGLDPLGVLNTQLAAFQALLSDNGIPLHWDARCSHAAQTPAPNDTDKENGT